MRSTRIFSLINRMAKPHDLFLLRESVFHIALDLIHAINLKQDFHDGSVCPTVQWSGQSAQRGGHTAIHIGERAGDYASSEGRSIQFVIGLENQSHVEDVRVKLVRHLALEHVKKIGRDV